MNIFNELEYEINNIIMSQARIISIIITYPFAIIGNIVNYFTKEDSKVPKKLEDLL